MEFKDSIEKEVTALEFYIEQVPAFLLRQTATAARRGDIALRDAYRMTQTLALEGGVHHLNSLVDGGLLILANRTRKDIKSSDMGRSRETLIGEIEGRIGVELKALPGWDDVEQVRLDANALKHRLGLTFGRGTETTLDIKGDVSVTPGKLLTRLKGIRQWLVDIEQRMTQKA